MYSKTVYLEYYFKISSRPQLFKIRFFHWMQNKVLYRNIKRKSKIALIFRCCLNFIVLGELSKISNGQRFYMSNKRFLRKSVLRDFLALIPHLQTFQNFAAQFGKSESLF